MPVTYFEGASGTDWGRWHLDALQKRRSNRADWWLAPSLCPANNSDFGLGGASSPPCLQRRYSRCAAATTRGVLPRFCNELCYTLSVVAALDDFLRSGFQRALLLEDDICATPALVLPSTRRALYWMRTNPAAWDAIKLGDCYRGLREVPAHYQPSEAEALVTGQCAASPGVGGEGWRARNALLDRIPRGQCSHALAVSRRMARQIVDQAFPVSDVFDNLLVSHFARQAAHLAEPLRMRAFNLSLFAQVAKVQKTGSFARALKSQNHGAPTHLARSRRESRDCNSERCVS